MRKVVFTTSGKFDVNDNATEEEVYDLMNEILESENTQEHLDYAEWHYEDEEE